MTSRRLLLVATVFGLSNSLAFATKTGHTNFFERHGNEWTIASDPLTDTPTVAFGGAIHTTAVSMSPLELERASREFVADHPDFFGVGEDQLILVLLKQV